MATMPWFRCYSDMLADKKLIRAARERSLPLTQVIGVWVGLLCMASEAEPRGRLYLSEGVPLTTEDLAAALGMPEGELSSLLNVFAMLAMMGMDEAGAWVITNWGKRQFEGDSSATRVSRWRQRNATATQRPAPTAETCNADVTPIVTGDVTHGDASCNVTVTLPQRYCNIPDTDTDTESDTDMLAAATPQHPPRTRKPSTADPRTKHPAIIEARRAAGNKNPPRELYDKLIETLGDAPNVVRLAACRLAWRERGYNPSAWSWALEWYRNGIPARNGAAPPRALATSELTTEQNELNEIALGR